MLGKFTPKLSIITPSLTVIEARDIFHRLIELDEIALTGMKKDKWINYIRHALSKAMFYRLNSPEEKLFYVYSSLYMGIDYPSDHYYKCLFQNINRERPSKIQVMRNLCQSYQDKCLGQNLTFFHQAISRTISYDFQTVTNPHKVTFLDIIKHLWPEKAALVGNDPIKVWIKSVAYAESESFTSNYDYLLFAIGEFFLGRGFFENEQYEWFKLIIQHGSSLDPEIRFQKSMKLTQHFLSNAQQMRRN